MGKFDIYDYVHNNRFKINKEPSTANKTPKGYNDTRKQLLNDIKVIDGKFDLKESMEANKPLGTDVKKHFLEIISTYKGFEERMTRNSDIASIAETLGGVVEAAKTLSLSEDGDWFDKVTIKRNMKELEKLDKDFSKVSEEARSLDNRLQALYEDMGNILSRYYTISDVDPQIMKQRLGESLGDAKARLLGNKLKKRFPMVSFSWDEGDGHWWVIDTKGIDRLIDKVDGDADMPFSWDGTDKKLVKYLRKTLGEPKLQINVPHKNAVGFTV